jgi:2',3'-cyclic-nucleotide 2'-phosphodiesterase (5'-nucleotidase family)/DNA-binding beta-propeller fold protein YncE
MAASTTPTEKITLSAIGNLSAGLSGAEISAFDAASQRLFVTSSVGLQIVDLSDPTAPALVTTIDFTAPAFGAASTDVTSVAVFSGTVAVSLVNADKTIAGQVVLLNAATGAIIGTPITVGNHPDMVTFTPDGTKLLVANEGELTSAGVDSPGSVSIIDVATRVATPVTFTAFDGQEAALRTQGVRIATGVSASNDLEPEYIAVSADGTKAFVTLQENNAVAVLDITTATITGIVGLGLKDFSTLLADFSDRDGAGDTASVNLTTGNPVFGLYMPDGIASYSVGGQTYYVIANEGDDRDDFLNPDETIRVGAASYDLDNTLFPNEATLKATASLGRLTALSNAGDTDTDGDIDQITVTGARSFSILDSAGNQVFDSADILERIQAATPGSQTGGTALDDTRSDNKGPEPESVIVKEIGGRFFAFVALERGQGGVAIFDVTDPTDVTFTGYETNAGDVSPEGLLFIPAADSPNGEDLLIVSNEVSNTVTVYDVDKAPFTLQLLHFADGEAGLLAGETAPNLAALVDAFDGDYANTLILAGGDNFLPGPFLAAGTDATVAATHSRGNNPGAADIEIHNRIGVEASTIGNHEFDLGTNAFSDAINDAAFPYLSANLDFSADSAISARYQETVGVGGLENVTSLARKIVPSAVVEKGGEVIGLVGVTTQILETISSTGGVEVKGFAGDGSETNDMAQLAALLQPVIDDLLGQGVNKIVLMAHLQQIQFEQALAPLLEGVDIILAAGSNTRLGDADDTAVAFPGHAADFANTYPIVTAGKDGKTTVIVNTDNEYTYLGRLVVDFDEDGEIITGSLTGNVAINGAYAATEANVAAAWGDTDGDLTDTAFADGTKGEQVADITEAVDAVIQTKDGQVFGFTNVYLEGERNQVRNQETNLGNITADANLNALTSALGSAAPATFVASLKNGGGVRAQIGSVDVVTGDKETTLANPDAGKPEGGVSQLDIENSLRFNNGLMAFDTTAAGLKAILEHGVAVLGNQGRYPQIGGIRFSYDEELPAGSRVTNVALIDENNGIRAVIVENGVVNPDAPATITMVTLNFLAQGGDSYPMKANGENFRYLLNDGTLSAPVDESLDFTAAANVPANILGEQQAMSEYMQDRYATPETAFDEADTGQANDTRIQNLDFRSDNVLTLGGIYEGTTGGDSLKGGISDDAMDGAGGNDTLTGGAGDDTVLGGSGDDRLLGGEGDDSMNGGTGLDIMTGGDGNDTVLGGSGDDRLLGGEGDDSMNGGTGLDIMTGGDGNDTMSGNAGNDRLYGEAGNDSLDGGAGDDVLAGGVGRDILLGGSGNDRLVGDAGLDVLIGAAGKDVMTGGASADTFVFTALLDSRGSLIDVITDFRSGVDKIDVRGIDANTARPGDQAFSFLATADFSNRAGELRFEVVGNRTFVEFDVNGDARADMQIQLTGKLNLISGDFVL